jgi:hypothetical protein
MTEHHTTRPRSPFSDACAKRLRAKAALAELCAGREASDEAITLALDAVSAAEWKLLQTPAENLAEIRERARIVLELFTAEDEAGVPTDNRNRLMLAALVSEICSVTPLPDAEAAA